MKEENKEFFQFLKMLSIIFAIEIIAIYFLDKGGL